ncbi:MAG TPA: TIGR03084 family metal-binding protein [Streptosporangiaceae bacterium]|nr:TIGR03084 family metal-binding protein [Streptosporangiaceae bacterium]
MAVSMVELVEDLRAETLDLERLLAPLSDTAWDAPTPAAGWAVRDQVSHLAWFDDAAVQAVTAPEEFRAAAAEMQAGGMSPDDIAARYRALPVAELRAWFSAARSRLLDVFAGVDATARIAWYGPDMSAASFVTARLMETWAHGQDIADALGVARPPTDRLRHVAYIGVRALAYSFAVHGRLAPRTPVRVELTLPSGAALALGPETTADAVRGDALDFCLVVTRRRHISDVALEVTGPVAAEWMSIAQAFAGPPGPGRRPGQFPRA